MTYDWSYELTVERLHTILQHRFVSFKGWCERQVSKISEKVGRDVKKDREKIIKEGLDPYEINKVEKQKEEIVSNFMFIEW